MGEGGQNKIKQNRYIGFDRLSIIVNYSRKKSCVEGKGAHALYFPRKAFGGHGHGGTVAILVHFG